MYRFVGFGPSSFGTFGDHDDVLANWRWYERLQTPHGRNNGPSFAQLLGRGNRRLKQVGLGFQPRQLAE